MNIELASSILAALSALVAFWLAWRREQEGFKPRRLEVFGALLVVLTALCGYEAYARKEAMENVPRELEREWVLMQDARISHLEIEAVAPRGLIAPTLIDVSRGVAFAAKGVDLGAEGSRKSERIQFADSFAASNVAKNGRIGYPVLEVERTRGASSPIESSEIKDVTCVSSMNNARSVKVEGGAVQGNFCSISVTHKLRDSSLTLAKIGATRSVELTVRMPERAACFGECTVPFIFSVRAVIPVPQKFNALKVELSPMILRRAASLTSKDDATYTFMLGGKVLSEVAKSVYLQSLGYRDPGHFAFTKGVLNYWYMRLTKRTETGTFVDEVWVTSPDATDDAILQAIAEKDRSGAQPFRNEEWCGFGDVLKVDRSLKDERPLCWYRFVVFSMTDKDPP